MSTRTYAIPALAAIALSTTGCLAMDPIMGDWDMVEVDGEDDIEGSMSLEVDDGEIVGEFEVEYYEYYEMGGDVEGEKTDRNEYDIEIDLEMDGDPLTTLEMECVLDGDELECDVDEAEIVFERD